MKLIELKFSFNIAKKSHINSSGNTRPIRNDDNHLSGYLSLGFKSKNDSCIRV